MERCCILQWLIFCILSMSECTTEVRGFESQNVTLPCKYDAKYWDLSHVCWGRGTIPATGGCNNEVISTDGTKVTNRVLSRYQLLGDLMTGDVSLTIINTTEKDSGVYGCRMQYSGPFNDGKIEITLTIKKAPLSSTPRTPDNETLQTLQTLQTYHTEDYSTESSSQYSDTFSTQAFKTASNQGNPWSHSNQVWLIISILLVLIVLVIPSALVFRKLRKEIAMVSKIAQNSGGIDGHKTTASSPEPHTEVAVIDNIYEIEENDTDDYEKCP
ncbi:hypothetical protein DPEC_G00227460 [Dallia pectoralis]|uniref:Uncharacterized protein n=1 Tax=Dallia pectoralis TaxID=75939 RepID=A0ACC2G184_DALPE|nr:hypothetical protein DPEC_G00227460 [Dallia pectoralis]